MPDRLARGLRQNPTGSGKYSRSHNEFSNEETASANDGSGCSAGGVVVVTTQN